MTSSRARIPIPRDPIAVQKIVFETARDVFDQMAPTWAGSRDVLIARLVPLVEAFLASDRLAISPAVFQEDPRRRRILRST